MTTTDALQYPANGSRYGDQPANGRSRQGLDADILDSNIAALRAVPAESVSRRAVSWDGVRVEIIQSVTHDMVELRYHGRRHLLLVYEEGVRDEGETVVDDLPVSSLRTLRGKLTFVPAGHEYREWQRARVRSRVICFCFDPAKMPIDADGRSDAAALASRLFFENDVLWDTAVKLALAIEDGSENERYSACGRGCARAPAHMQ